jgi:hypothetical protein
MGCYNYFKLKLDISVLKPINLPGRLAVHAIAFNGQTISIRKKDLASSKPLLCSSIHNLMK